MECQNVLSRKHNFIECKPYGWKSVNGQHIVAYGNKKETVAGRHWWCCDDFDICRHMSQTWIEKEILYLIWTCMYMYLNCAYKCTAIRQKDTLMTFQVTDGVVKRASLWIMYPALWWSPTKILFVLNGWTDMWTVSLKKCSGRNHSPTRCWICGMHPRSFHITVFPTQYSCKLQTLFTVTGWKILILVSVLLRSAVFTFILFIPEQSVQSDINYGTFIMNLWCYRPTELKHYQDHMHVWFQVTRRLHFV